MAQVEMKLEDMRKNLTLLRKLGYGRLYAEGLIEYARLLGQWEKTLTSETYRGKNG